MSHERRDRIRYRVAPRTFFFGGKTAPAYHLAKLIIKFINNLAHAIDNDPAVRGRLKGRFSARILRFAGRAADPRERCLEPDLDCSYEASGTSNMKFMMNGALTIGTRDEATVEIAEEAGEENVFLFGLTTEQVASSRGWYSPYWHYENEPETRAALDLVFSDYFSRNDPGVFNPLREVLLTSGDFYMHLADLTAYLQADSRLIELYANRDAWTKKSILNVARSGKFSSDRTVAQYASDIWKVKPCPVPQ